MVISVMHPFTNNAGETVGAIGESALLQDIRDWLGAVTPPPPYGMGDDCAVFPSDAGNFNLVTVDALFYGQHFDDSLHPRDAGAKILKRNLSDIAAMGGKPNFAVMGLTLPARLKLEWLRYFYEGLRETAEAFQVTLLGGDLCESENSLGGHLTLLGWARRPLTRTGAKIEDAIMVTGELGGSALGKHYNFTPRIEEGIWLAELTEVHSMIDLTDGLLKDLPALVPPDCSASLERKALPVSSAAHELASDITAEAHALGDGEDYELLFTLDGDTNPGIFIKKWKESFDTELTVIGKMVGAGKAAEPGGIVDAATGEPLAMGKGYEHFG